MPNQVQISEEEEKICRFIAQLRNRGNLDAGVHDARIDQYDGPIFTFIGWATEHELLREENLKDWGYGPGKEMYALPPDKLHKDIEGIE